MSNSSHKLTTIALAISGLFCCSASAAPINWNTASDGVWNVANNWDTAMVPIPSSDVAIGFAAPHVVTHGAGSDTISTLATNGNTTVLVNGGSSLSLSNGGTNAGTIQVGGASAGRVNLNGGLFTNTGGLLKADDGGLVTLNGVNISGGTLNSTGSGKFAAASSYSNLLNGTTLNGTLDATTTVNSRERISNGMVLNGNVNIANGGIVSLDGTLGASNSIGGNGVFNLNDAGARLALEGNGTSTLGANIVVRGQGNIGQPLLSGGTNNLINNGRISADVNGGTLTITPGAGYGDLTNNNLIDARNGATLNLSTITVNNASGVINAQNNSVVRQDGSYIGGGIISSVGSGVFRANSSAGNVLDGLTVNGTLDLATITNARERVTNNVMLNGAVQIANGGIFSVMGGSQTIGGNATINLNDSAARLALEGNGTTTLASTVVVRGQGNIGQPAVSGGTNNLVNNGRISSDVNGGTLTITPGATNGNVTNNGVLEAINGSSLVLSTDVIGNGGSQIFADSSSKIVQNGVTVSGVINTAGAGLFTAISSGNNVLDGVTVNGTLDLSTIANARERVTNNVILNGAVQIANGGVLSVMGGNQTIGGNATINLNDSSAHLALEGNGTTTLASTVVVRGQGNIGQPAVSGGTNNLVNNGRISSDVNGGTLTITPGASNGKLTNNSVLEAINGSSLVLSTNVIGNGGSQIFADSSSKIVQNGVAVSGAINTAGAGLFTAISSGNNVLDAVTLNGTLDLSSVSNARERVINSTTINGAVNISNGGVLSVDNANTGGSQTISGKATINLNDPAAHLALEGNGTTTLASTVVVRGQGSIGSAMASGGTNNLVNNGRISSDVNGGTLTITPGAGNGNVTNNNLIDARAGGALHLLNLTVNNAGGAIDAKNSSMVLQDGSSIIGGIVSSSGSGVIRAVSSGGNLLDGVTLNGSLDLSTVTNARERIDNGLTLNGAINIANGGILSVMGSNQTIGGNGTLNLNDSGARLSLEGNATTTVGANVLIRGQGNIGTAAYSGGTNNLVNQGTILGDGGVLTIVPGAGYGGFTNNGLVRASAGTVTIQPALTGTGVLQVDSAGTVNLANLPNTQGKLSMGASGSVLNIGTQNLTITTDYTNAQFGVGNAFNRRAGVSGTGQILASGDVEQVITGANVTNGNTANATLTIGNVHVGNNTVQYQIANSGTTGPALRGAIQTTGGGANISDARLSGAGVTAGNYGPVATGSSTGSLAVNFNAAAAGALSPLTAQAVNIVNNFDNVSSQLLSIQVGATAAAYNLAQGSATPAPVTLANQRVGGTGSQVLTVSNTAASGLYTEGLNAGFGTNTGSITNNGGAINLLTGGASSTAMSVGVDTASAGAKSGTVTLNYVSDGTGTSGLGTTNVGSQTVTVSGDVYRLAQGSASTTPVSFGNLRVGDVASQALTVHNTAAADGFSEKLNASFGGLTGAATTNAGGIALLAAGGSNNAMTVGINTSTAGAKSGSVALNYVSDGNGSSGLSAIAAGNQTVNVSGDVYRLAQGNTTSNPIVFANTHVGDTASQVLTVRNTAVADGFSERLSASFGGNAGAASNNGGNINLLAAGGSNNSAMSARLDTSTAGAKSGSVTLNYVSDGSGTSGLVAIGAGSQTVNVSGNVYRLASANTLGALSFGNVHVGDTVQQALSISNTAIADGFSEKLNASFGASSDARITSSGSISQLVAGASNATSMIVGLNTSAAGSVNGTQVLNFASDGTGTSGLGITGLASQTIDVTGDIATSGSVYRLASAGSATPSPVNFGNVRIGSSADRVLSISNSAVNDGFSEKLNASISSNGAPVTASGAFNLLAAQSTDSSSLHVGIDTSSAGAKSGSATIALVSDGTGTSGLGTTTLAPQTVKVSGAVYRTASPTIGATSVTIAARVGDSVSADQAVSITNSSPDIYTEGLKVTASAIGNAQSNGGSIANLAAQASDNSAIKVGLASTASAGTSSGQLSLNMVSTGAGTTGASDLSLGSQVITVVGKVYQQAVAAVNTAAVNFGIVHVGDSVAAQDVSVSNNASASTLNDVLKGRVGSVSGPVTAVASANLGAGLGAGATGNVAVSLNNTNSAGLINGNVMLAFVSSNADMTDLRLSGQTLTISGQVNNYAKADILKTGGAGSLNRNGSTITLNLGTFMQGSGSVATELEVRNNVTGLSDLLKGSFDLSGANDFSFTGFGAFSGLVAGAAEPGLDIAFDTSTLGLFSDQITLNGFGYNDGGYSDQQTLTLVLTANVVAGGTVPEPRTLALVAIALAGLMLSRRRRSSMH